MSPRSIHQAILFVFPYLGFITSNGALARGHVCLPAAPEVCHDLVKLRHARWEPGRDGTLRLVARENATRVFTRYGIGANEPEGLVARLRVAYDSKGSASVLEDLTHAYLGQGLVGSGRLLDAAGETRIEREYAGDTLVKETRTGPDARVMVRERVADASGRLVRERVTIDGRTTRLRKAAFDAAGRLTKFHFEEGGLTGVLSVDWRNGTVAVEKSGESVLGSRARRDIFSFEGLAPRESPLREANDGFLTRGGCLPGVPDDACLFKTSHTGPVDLHPVDDLAGPLTPSWGPSAASSHIENATSFTYWTTGSADAGARQVTVEKWCNTIDARRVDCYFETARVIERTTTWSAKVTRRFTRGTDDGWRLKQEIYLYDKGEKTAIDRADVRIDRNGLPQSARTQREDFRQGTVTEGSVDLTYDRSGWLPLSRVEKGERVRPTRAPLFRSETKYAYE